MLVSTRFYDSTGKYHSYMEIEITCPATDISEISETSERNLSLAITQMQDIQRNSNLHASMYAILQYRLVGNFSTIHYLLPPMQGAEKK